MASVYKCSAIVKTVPPKLCLERQYDLRFDESSPGDGTMWQYSLHLSEWDNMTPAKPLWTSKSTFISMTLNSLPIKDKSPFSHTQLYLSVSPHKGEGQLIHAKHASSFNFCRPLWALFLIKRGSLSFLKLKYLFDTALPSLKYLR